MTIQEAAQQLLNAPEGHKYMTRSGEEIIRLMGDKLQQRHPRYSHMTDVDFGISDLCASDWEVKEYE